MSIRTRTSGIMVPAFVEPTEVPLTFYSVERGLHFPPIDVTGSIGTITLSSNANQAAHIGKVYIGGRGTKTISSAGGAIQFRVQTGSTFASGTSNLLIGIQDVSTSGGPIAQPDGVFDVGNSLNGATGGITSASWNTVAISSGSKTLSNGDIVAVVWQMSGLAATDTVIVGHGTASLDQSRQGFGTTNYFSTSAWQTTLTNGAGNAPNVVIQFDDGTLGILEGQCPPFSVISNDTFGGASNPNERGMIFQSPWTCKIDALWAMAGVVNSSGNFTISVYSDPTGTPTLVPGTQVTVNAAQWGVSGNNQWAIFPLPTEVQLARATNYVVAINATSTATNDVRLQSTTLGATDHRQFVPYGTTMQKATRQSSLNGAFTLESPQLTMYPIGIRISALQST